MADLILVLNAGSSSIKFRAFDAGPAEPELVLYGQVEGLSIGGKVSAATFSARDAGGAPIGGSSSSRSVATSRGVSAS